MWNLDKPLLEDAIQDISKIIQINKGVINDADKPVINYIYRLYDNSKGVISLDDNNRCRMEVQNKLYSMYDSHTYENGSLYNIRKELFKSATFCPICGIGEPSQLDHHMPRSVYKSLSLCRLNLVPLCSVCNNKKLNKDPFRFVHPYYAEFPEGVLFLVADIHIDVHQHKMSWKYRLDLKGIDKVLADKIKFQAKTVKLLNRLQQASNSYLSELFCFQSFSTDTSLKDFLRNTMNKTIYIYGDNDWRTALIKGLFYCMNFKKEEAAQFTSRIKPLNKGVNV